MWRNATKELLLLYDDRLINSCRFRMGFLGGWISFAFNAKGMKTLQDLVPGAAPESDRLYITITHRQPERKESDEADQCSDLMDFRP